MGNTGEEQGWGASVGVGFVFVEVGFQQEKEKSQDGWRNMRLPSLTQSPHYGFLFLGERKKPKGSGWRLYVGKKNREFKWS